MIHNEACRSAREGSLIFCVPGCILAVCILGISEICKYLLLVKDINCAIAWYWSLPQPYYWHTNQQTAASRTNISTKLLSKSVLHGPGIGDLVLWLQCVWFLLFNNFTFHVLWRVWTVKVTLVPEMEKAYKIALTVSRPFYMSDYLPQRARQLAVIYNFSLY